MILTIVNIILVVSAMIGMYMIAHKNRMGFVVFTFVEFSMTYIGFATANYGLCVAAGLYLVMNVYSFLKWGKNL